jgi:LacI family transcriptional regulator
MREIAKKAGVSLKTVSRVVNNENNVAPETKEKILKTIDEMHYVPNAAARGLSRGKAMSIGFSLSWPVKTNYSAMLIDATLSVCNKKDYSLALFSWDWTTPSQIINAYLGKQIDGVILDTKASMDEKLINQLNALNAPYVTIHPNSLDQTGEESYVIIDNFKSAKMAVNYLIELGHRSIGCATENKPFSHQEQRIDGYRKALSDAGIPIVNSLIKQSPSDSFQGGFICASKLISENKDLSAIFCVSDELAMGVMNGVWQTGRKIPDDISVIGFDDIQYAEAFTPPLTTVHQPIHLIAETAVNHLIKRINDPTTEQIQTVLPTQLIVRKSCKPFQG